jgi:hypothetical protein
MGFKTPLMRRLHYYYGKCLRFIRASNKVGRALCDSEAMLLPSGAAFGKTPRQSPSSSSFSSRRIEQPLLKVGRIHYGGSLIILGLEYE